MGDVISEEEVRRLLQVEVPESVVAAANAPSLFRQCVVLLNRVNYENAAHFNEALTSGYGTVVQSVLDHISPTRALSTDDSGTQGGDGVGVGTEDDSGAVIGLEEQPGTVAPDTSFEGCKVTVLRGRPSSLANLQRELQEIVRVGAEAKAQATSNQDDETTEASHHTSKLHIHKLDSLVLLVDTEFEASDVATFAPAIDVVVHCTMTSGTLLCETDQSAPFVPSVGDKVLLRVDGGEKSSDDAPESLVVTVEEVDAGTNLYTLKVVDDDTAPLHENVPVDRLAPCNEVCCERRIAVSHCPKFTCACVHDDDVDDDDAAELAAMNPFDRLQRGMDDLKCGVLVEAEYQTLIEEQIGALTSDEAAKKEAADIAREEAEAQQAALAVEQAALAAEKALAESLAGEGNSGDEDDKVNADADDTVESKEGDDDIPVPAPVELLNAIPVGHVVNYTLTAEEHQAAVEAATAAYDAQHGTPDERNALASSAQAAQEALEQAQEASEPDEDLIAQLSKRAKAAASAADFPELQDPPSVVRARVHEHEVPEDAAASPAPLYSIVLLNGRQDFKHSIPETALVRRCSISPHIAVSGFTLHVHVFAGECARW